MYVCMVSTITNCLWKTVRNISPLSAFINETKRPISIIVLLVYSAHNICTMHTQYIQTHMYMRTMFYIFCNSEVRE